MAQAHRCDGYSSKLEIKKQKPNLKRLWDEALQCSEQVSLSDAATGHPDSSWVSNSFEAKAPTVSPQKVTAKG